jgi:alpha-N-arabinofuranosidase
MSLSESQQSTHMHVQAQGRQSASLTVDDQFPVGTVSDRLFGTLVEHLGRCVYGGIYDPKSTYANEDGFRTDVMKLVRELGITTVRYPGGNFVSGYRWEDGVGPVEKRPRRLDLAWHSTETNRMGLHEMEKWLHEVNPEHPLELMEAVNLGTRGLESALDLLEYANIPSGTKLSDMRRANGAEKPFNIRMWCLGNEMDGPWQLGHLTAQEYASKVRLVAAGMRQIDPDLELVACGSSSHGMPTFGSWEGTVLDQAYDLINFVSCHAYYQPRVDKGVRDMRSFLASGVDMDGFISDVVASIDAARARAKSSHDVNISFDEWNVWYTNEPGHPHAIDDWPVGPHLLENHYTLADAVVVGDLLITLLRHADRVRAASIAQLVNVIAPIFVPESGPAYRQTTFFPFARTAELTKGGTVLTPRETGARTSTETYGDVSMVDSVAVRRANGGLAVFAVNRSLDQTADFTITLPAAAGASSSPSFASSSPSASSAPVVNAETLSDEDIDAQNTADDPNRVALKPNTTVRVDEADSKKVHVDLPPVSWTVVTID